MNVMNCHKPPLYPRRQIETIPPRPYRKRKAEDGQNMTAKRQKLFHSRMRKRANNKTTINVYKRLRLGEDKEKLLFGILILANHDADTYTVYHHTNDIILKIKNPHLGSIWLPHSTHGVLR
jgi:hypothetical protein